MTKKKGFLVTAATKLELNAYLRDHRSQGTQTLVSGVGMVESAVRLSSWLAEQVQEVSTVINIGIAGAYIFPGSPQLLDLCLARAEVLADLGVCYSEQIEPLDEQFVPGGGRFILESPMLSQAEKILEHEGYTPQVGNFLTVQGVSATRQRGEMLAALHGGMCENMEGAAIARVCQEYSLPFIELRCISNLVEDRDRQTWKIKEAAARCGEAAACLIQELAS